MTALWHRWGRAKADELTDEQLAEVQDRLGVRFPDDYIEVVRTNQGSTPDPSTVRLSDGTTTSLDMLLPLRAESGLDVLSCSEDSDVLPERVIVFALDPGDNIFGFDYRSTDVDPPVVFFAIDDPAAESEFLAASFTELIQSLRAD